MTRGAVHRYEPIGKRAEKLDPVTITAAASPIEPPTETRRSKPVMPAQPWQSQVMGYYDMMGICWNPAQFIATAMSKMRFHLALKNDDGKYEDATADAPEDLVAIVEALDKAAPQAGRLNWLIGEYRLCQFRDPDDDPADPVRWGAFSPMEIKITDEGRKILRAKYGTVNGVEYTNISEEDGEPEPGQMRTWRFWRPHPKASELPDSPVRAVLDRMEQLWWLTMSERADLQSRIADNGILLVPTEIDWEPPAGTEQPGEGEGDDAEDGTLIEYLGEAMMTAIQDPGSAAAAVPPVVEGPGDALEKMRVLHTHEGSQSLVFVSQREKALVEGIAQDLPLPAEVVLGLSQANHWTAWKVEDEKWQLTEPWVTDYAEDLTRLVLQPILKASGVSEPYVIWYDYSGLVSDPDRGSTAIKLHQEGLLSGNATLAANGWTEDEAMDDEELAWYRAIKLRDASIATGEQQDEPAVAGDPNERPPAEDDAPDDDGSPDGEASMLKQRALEFANSRARATVGAALRGRKRSCPECLEGLADVENSRLLAHLDTDQLERLGVRATILVEQLTARFVADALALGYDATPHLAPLAQWYQLTLHAPDESLPDDLVERIGCAVRSG